MADNEDDDGGWMKVESRTKKNKFYFFNVYTGESVWKLPESSKVSRQRTREANCNGNSNNKTKPKASRAIDASGGSLIVYGYDNLLLHVDVH